MCSSDLENTVLGLFFDVKNPMEVGDADPQAAGKPVRGGRRHRELQLWTDFFGTGSSPYRSAQAGRRVRRPGSWLRSGSGGSVSDRSPVNRRRDSDRLGCPPALVLHENRVPRRGVDHPHGWGGVSWRVVVLRNGAVSGPGGHGGGLRIARMGHPCVRRPRGRWSRARSVRTLRRCGTEPGVDAVDLRIGRSVTTRVARSDAATRERTSKGNKAHGRTGRPTAGNGRGSSELGGGATPRSRRGGLAELAGCAGNGALRGPSGGIANGTGATATVTWNGCSRGYLRGV